MEGAARQPAGGGRWGPSQDSPETLTCELLTSQSSSKHLEVVGEAGRGRRAPRNRRSSQERAEVCTEHLTLLGRMLPQHGGQVSPEQKRQQANKA